MNRTIGSGHPNTYAAERINFPGIEKPQSLKRIFIECLFYMSILLIVFPSFIKDFTIPDIAGGIVVIIGILSIFVIMYMQKERLAPSVWFVLTIVIAANISQVFGNGETPILGRGLPDLLHWLILLSITCHLVKNKETAERILIFFSIVIIIAVLFGGIYIEQRLDVGEEIGGALQNANRLAYISGLFAIACLFWSLGQKRTIRFLFLLLSLFLFLIVLKTVSRGGILAVLFGLALLVLSILLDSNVRLKGILFLMSLFIIFSIFIYYNFDLLEFYLRRFQEDSSRQSVYNKWTLLDLKETIIFGKGKLYISRSGIQAHNSFLYTHMTFGGITAWPYLLWLLYLCKRIFAMLHTQIISINTKIVVIVMFGMALISQFFSNQGYYFLSTIYATAIIEKYAIPYNKIHNNNST